MTLAGEIASGCRIRDGAACCHSCRTTPRRTSASRPTRRRKSPAGEVRRRGDGRGQGGRCCPTGARPDDAETVRGGPVGRASSRAAGLSCRTLGRVHRRRCSARKAAPSRWHATSTAQQGANSFGGSATHPVPDPGAGHRAGRKGARWSSRSTANGTWSSCSAKGSRPSSPASTRRRGGPISGQRAGSRRRSRPSCRC